MWPLPAELEGCPFSHCCLWTKLCSPETPRVDPSREYACMPADADDSSPARSLLVGIMATAGADRSLQLHRFRVAGSGRVIGRNGGALETLGDGYYRPATRTSRIRAACAVGSPDGRRLSLCFFSREYDFVAPKGSQFAPPVPLQLQMDLGAADGKGVAVSRLPGLPPEVGPLMPTCPISAAGDLWAPYLTGVYGPTTLVMQRFDRDAAKWVKVQVLALKRPPMSADMSDDGIPALHGHAVIGDTILLSFWPYHLFYTFNCSTCEWAVVATSRKDGMYAAIRERGVYVEEDDTIYFLSAFVIYAYKLRKDQDRYQMAPPIYVGRVCPCSSHEGYGFLSYLGGRVMCSVWIGVKLPCDCDAKHVLITTFRVKGDGSEHFVPKGVKILHSTFRRLDMAPSKSVESHLEFSFLQEYKEFNHEGATPAAKRRRGDLMESSILLEDMEVPASFNVVKSSNMLACCSPCREVLNEMPWPCAAMLERSAIRPNKTLYIICQVASHSTVYKINILDGRLMCHDKTLTPHCILETSMCGIDDEDIILNRLRRSWHFVCDSKSIYAAPSVENKVYSCCLDQGNINHIDSTRPAGVEFRIVVLVGTKVVAISDTLQDVYNLSQGKWMCHKTSGPPDLDKEVCLSGYVVLSSSTFLVSDAEENRCFLHDIVNDKWNIVERLKPNFIPISSCLSERCVYAKGFIYSCTHDGLSAFELVEQGGSYYLGEVVNLEFSWLGSWERSRMCLEYVGVDTSSGSIMFCVARDGTICQPGYPIDEEPLRITLVQVKTVEMPGGKLEPKSIGHVDVGTTFVQGTEGVLWTRDLFAPADIQARC